uniref:A.thaliana phyD protein n=1 Tax=Arabidopsis thaliana TaxID=3702 RepID=A2NXL5_ARATH|nr:unnamed protein product [Arabidopsis thaliana]
MSIIFELLQ